MLSLKRNGAPFLWNGCAVLAEYALNDKVTITYHDGGDTWSYSLHFKYVDHPETLIMVDQNGFDWEYSTTDLDDALVIRETKNIKDY